MLPSAKSPRRAAFQACPTARLACALVLAGLAASARAESGPPPPLSLHAFGTLGLVRSSSGDAEFVRDLSQAEGSRGTLTARNDSIAGVQASYRWNERFEAVVQGVSHYRYDRSFSPELTWAFLKVTPAPNLALRFGRIGTELFMLADSRLVGYSYLTVRPSVEFYGSLPFNYVDGADGRYTLPLGGGLLSLDAFTGVLREKVPAAGEVWDLDDSRMSGLSVEWQKGPWQGRLSYSHVRFEQNGAPLERVLAGLSSASALGFPSARSAAEQLRLAGSTGIFHSLGLIYDDGDWQASFAWNTTRRSSAIFQDSRSGYLLVGRHWGRLTPFAGYSWTHSTPKFLATGLPDIPFATLNAGIAGFMQGTHQDQHSVTVGGRWDFQSNMALKAQVDFLRAAPDSRFLQQDVSPGWNGRSTVLSLALDFFY